MSVNKLVEIIHSGSLANWTEHNDDAFKTLFGGSGGRYPQAAKSSVTLRAPEMSPDSGIPFAAYIHPSNPKSGPYSGMSFVLFPSEGQPCLIAMVIGTQGLAPDEMILGRAGHARKIAAVVDWLNAKHGTGRRVAWAKHDPTRNEVSIPSEVAQNWPEYAPVFQRYGREIYAVYRPGSDHRQTAEALVAFLDILFQERGFTPMTSAKSESEAIRSAWFDCLMPTVSNDDVHQVLQNRRFVIIQGPPGTGKTRMATSLLRQQYGGFGESIQFHANTTYENFVGGLSPLASSGGLGFHFAPKPGHLMQAAARALAEPGRPFLLHIDEINRADLAKILGEAIFLFEPSESDRRVELPCDFGPPFHTSLRLPPNLHVLGTMNSADRSIAIVDVAIRRRFGFVSLWPSMGVVQTGGCTRMQEAFRLLLSLFIEHATEDVLPLIPGHSYFLEQDDRKAQQRLLTNLAPLLEEYLSQGYVSSFSEQVRSYLQWLRAQ